MTSATISFRDLDSSVTSTTDGLFGITKYPAKFIPQVVNYIPDREASAKAITDPFAGVEITGLSAHIRHKDTELWDINSMLLHYHKSHRLVLESANILYLKERVVLDEF
jgi:hypothetical protein